jgi:Protein of unknown function (DUF3455)
MNTKVNHRSWLLLGSLFAISFLISGSEHVPPPQVPDILRAPDGQMVVLKAFGKGVQIYACRATTGDPGNFEWSFKAPEADLTNKDGKRIAKHYAGPTWEANDGSKVVGEVQQKADAPRAGAVPWLLLKAKRNEGTGTFARVTYIQRVDTEGGVAPTAGCDRAHIDTEARVDYRANYYFHAPKR